MLTISKASAGSGKTFRLTGEYLKLLFKEYSEHSGAPYRHILAVTFTNKATAEMKDRILSELDNLSTGGNSPYMEDLCRAAALSSQSYMEREKQIRIDAGILLREILNDYTGFNVSTIDSFFQTILRAFAREMGQSASYNVELDTGDVLMQAIDSMLNSLEEDDRADLLKWLIDLAVDGIEQGNGWDITGKLNSLGQQLFNEKFKMQGRDVESVLMNRENMGRYRDKLRAAISDFRKEVSALAAAALSRLSEAGLSVEDFPYGKYSGASGLLRMAEGEMEASVRFSRMAMAQNPDSSWCKSLSKNRSAIESMFYGEFGDAIRKIDSLINGRPGKEYRTACIIYRHFSVLGVLMDIRMEVDKWCRETNTVILPETNAFLHRIIDRDETPFIYEKAGTRIDHYMLDEFQDTSAMQWENFRPLISDSVDSGRDNLIVGDVKQSIYRWRNSDWRLLQSGILRDFDSRDIKMSPLDENYRSGRALVEFNNSFFFRAGIVLQQIYESRSGRSTSDGQPPLISSIYADVAQKIPSSRTSVGGHVRVEFVEKDETSGWKEKILERLPGRIEELLEKGFRAGDIALLVRSNDDGALVSNYLMDNGYSIVTEEALKISSSKSVGKVVSVLEYLSHPDDRIAQKLFCDTGVDISECADLPLYNLCETIITLLSAEDRRQVAFLQAFMDTVRDFCSKRGSDVEGFLKWWNEAGVRLSISAPDGADSVKVMTIHKSKGLGFEVVIIPFLADPFFKNSGILWCSPTGTPFSELGKIPVTISSSLMGTAFESDYLDEMLYQYIDSLNTAYVAFTRAKSELHIFSEKKKDDAKVSDMGQLLYSYLKTDVPGFEDVYESGEWCMGASEEEIFGEQMKMPEYYESFSDDGRIRASLRNASALDDAPDVRMHGILMHMLFSRIGVEEDAVSVIEDAVISGDIPVSMKEDVLKEVLERLSEAKSAGYRWFSGEYSVMNEVTVLSPEHGEIRPDRVMVRGSEAVIVDYKFGSEHDMQYVMQVGRYMDSLRRMGYSLVRGYLWYPDGIIEV